MYLEGSGFQGKNENAPTILDVYQGIISLWDKQ